MYDGAIVVGCDDETCSAAFICFRTLGEFEAKKIFRLSDQSESRHRNEIPKAENPL